MTTVKHSQWMPAAALALAAGVAGPVAAGDWLLGDWGGARQSLADRGLEFEAVVGVDVLANVDGGIDGRRHRRGRGDAGDPRRRRESRHGRGRLVA